VRIAIGLMLLCASGTAWSQDFAVAQMNSVRQPTTATGAELPKDDAAIIAAANFGRCIAARRDGAKMLGVLPESVRDRRLIFGVTMTPEICSTHGNFFELAPSFLRGSVAEYQLKRDFDLVSGKALHRPAKIFDLPQEGVRSALKANQKAVLSFLEYGRCVATVDLQNVSKLVSSNVRTAEERTAFKNLAPALSQCLAPGMTLKVNPFKLRGYLAEGAYRYLTSKGAS